MFIGYLLCKRAFLITVLLILLSAACFAQDSTAYTLPAKERHPARIIVPAALISYGIATRIAKPLRDFDHYANDKAKLRRKPIQSDDYLQFVPAAGVYGIEWCHIANAKHNLRDRTIVMATSHLIMATIVNTAKFSIDVQRPDGSSNNSFPSGHTATAFTGAHILFREYKDESVWLGVGGYICAALNTGTWRVLRERHWVSDVVTGAGVGIASAELGYLLLPVFQRWFGLQPDKGLLVIPAAGKNYYGVGLSYIF